MTASNRVADEQLGGRRSCIAGLVAVGVPRAGVAHQPDVRGQPVIGWYGLGNLLAFRRNGRSTDEA